MAIARADGEAEAAIERGGRVEIAHGVDDVIDAAGHGHITEMLLEVETKMRETLPCQA